MDHWAVVMVPSTVMGRLSMPVQTSEELGTLAEVLDVNMMADDALWLEDIIAA